MMVIQFLDEFIKQRLSSGEHPGFDGNLKNLDHKKLSEVRGIIKLLDAANVKPLLTELEAHDALSLNTELLNEIGKVHDSETTDNVIIRHNELDTAIDQLNES